MIDMWELSNVVAGFIIGWRIHNDIRSSGDMMLIEITEWKLQELLDKVLTESETNEVSINCKKREYMVDIQKKKH